METVDFVALCCTFWVLIWVAGAFAGLYIARYPRDGYDFVFWAIVLWPITTLAGLLLFDCFVAYILITYMMGGPNQVQFSRQEVEDVP